MSSLQLAQVDLHLPVSSADQAIATALLPATGEESAQGGQSWVTADILPDDVLLEMFDWYLLQSQEEAEDYELDVQAWHTLVHVCQRWRAIVFESRRRLNLRLLFTDRSSAETLAVWPSLPIIIWQSGNQMRGLDDIIEALGHNDRVCEISLLDIPSSQWEGALATMEQPFPALTELGIRRQDDEDDQVDEAALVVPDSFLGGSAPRLQHLDFDRVPFPGLPGLLSSATNLVHFYLWNIPYLGYFSPEAMVDCLYSLTKLEVLWLGFESSQPRLYTDIQRTPPILLPFLKCLKFKGASKYLEILVAPIYAPLFDSLEITFFYDPVFDTPQLLQFVSRTPNLGAPVEAYVDFSDESVSITFPGALPRKLLLEILCRPANSQLLSLAQVCDSSYPRIFIPAVKHLYIGDTLGPQLDLEDDTEDDQWLEVLRPFTAVKDLYLSWEIVTRIADALGGSGTEVLPDLQNLFLEEPLPSGADKEAIDQFVAARQHVNRSITISPWVKHRVQAVEVDGSSVVDDPSGLDSSSVLDASRLDPLTGFGPNLSSALDFPYSLALGSSPVVVAPAVEGSVGDGSPASVGWAMFGDSPMVVVTPALGGSVVNGLSVPDGSPVVFGSPGLGGSPMVVVTPAFDGSVVNDSSVPDDSPVVLGSPVLGGSPMIVVTPARLDGSVVDNSSVPDGSPVVVDVDSPVLDGSPMVVDSEMSVVGAVEGSVVDNSSVLGDQ